MSTILTERQQDILDASLRVIEHEGLKGFTMRNIAQQIGFTDAALYRHFPDKGAILEALARLFQSNTLENLESIQASPGLNALQKLHRFLERRAQEFESNRALTSILFSEELFRGEGQALSLNTATLETHARLLQVLVKEGQAEGSIRSDLPAGHLVMLLTGPMKQMVGSWKAQLPTDPQAPAASLVKTVEAFWDTYEKIVRV